ncbi:MAG: hypothetical protein CL993_03220 [Euryarchaeota archaeon]|nr:hypothetical protein [Euryarchaeota archaeon]
MKFLTKLLLLSCFALAFIFANNSRAKTSKSLNESVNKNVSFKEVDREESKEWFVEKFGLNIVED